MNVIMVGAGKAGRELISCLYDEGFDIVVIDENEEKIDRIIENYDVLGICGSATNIEILKEAGASNAFLVISATASDEINVLSAMFAKGLGAQHTIARVRNPEYLKQYDHMRDQFGISMLVNPDFNCAHEISGILHFPYAVNVETFANGRIFLVETIVKQNSQLDGVTLENYAQKSDSKFNFCAVVRNGKVFTPSGDFVFQSQDRVFLVGAPKYLAEICTDMGMYKEQVKDVMIIGASRIANYLVPMLEKDKMNVTVIDNDYNICEQFSEKFPSATVVYGNGTHRRILQEEGLSEMDAVVTLTGSDEYNLLISMFAEMNGVNKVVTKLSYGDLKPLLDKIGSDSCVSPMNITANVITQYARAKADSHEISSMLALYKLAGGMIEAAEFRCPADFVLCDTPLKDIKLKRNLVIAAVIRKGSILYPRGSDLLKEDDRVIVVSQMKLTSLYDILD